MPSPFDVSGRSLPIGGVALAMLIVFATTPAMSTETVLYSFTGGSDGIAPQAGVIADASGNLYGTTAGGGGGTGCNDGASGCGTVFELAPDGTETVLHAFAGGCDGAFPFAGLVADKAGNYYGTTEYGGVCNNDDGFGTVFKIVPGGAASVLYAFQGGSAGEYPTGGLIEDKKGNLYGAGDGGTAGFVFELTPKGKLHVVYDFQGGNDGDGPSGSLLMDKVGNIYGTTEAGGGGGCDSGLGCGTIFKIAPDGIETVLYAFQGGDDGWYPQTGVIVDGAGNLYGTTKFGGGASNYGTVFKVTSAGAESVLHAFQGGADGIEPLAGLIMDKAGNLYGTTALGGPGCKGEGSHCGVAFKLAPDGTETVLYAFDNVLGGRHPAAPLLMDKHGVLYGTTTTGGNDKDGVVFSVTAK